MFSGGNRTTAATWVNKDQHLKLRPYNEKLTALTTEICNDMGHAGSDSCLFETRTAFDCVLRHRVRKGGHELDNIGKCKFHIDNMKAVVSRSEYDTRMLDKKLKDLN